MTSEASSLAAPPARLLFPLLAALMLAGLAVTFTGVSHAARGSTRG